MFSSGPIILKIHELSLIYLILLKLLFGISWPQQYESLFALGQKLPAKKSFTNSADPYQTASEEAV